MLAPRAFLIVSTLTGLIVLAIGFGLGYTAQGYVQRGELLASYNGANQMRQDAIAAQIEAEREKAAARMVIDALANPLPQETPGAEAAEGREL